jgi:ribose transport system permease protein
MNDRDARMAEPHPAAHSSWSIRSLRQAAQSAVASRYFAIWPATVLLLAISPIIAKGSLSSGALSASVPFAAILAIAAIGETLTIQQRGLDFSLAATLSLATVIVTRYPGGHDDRLPVAILIVFASCAVSGLVSGLLITRLLITPLVATLGVNTLLLGTILALTDGNATAQAPPNLAHFASGNFLGVPSLVVVAAILVVAVATLTRVTNLGRRFIFVGTNPVAAYVLGIRVRRVETATYVVAALFYGVAGILLAGFVSTPGLSPGDTYLLPAVAAVVLGGTPLTGGEGSVLATGIGAFFLIQLQQVVFGAGAPSSVQLLIQGGVIAIGMALHNLRGHLPGFARAGLAAPTEDPVVADELMGSSSEAIIGGSPLDE